MPKRNYAFDKRQKDLKKKQKQEEKLRRRLERRAADHSTAEQSDVPEPNGPEMPGGSDGAA